MSAHGSANVMACTLHKESIVELFDKYHKQVGKCPKFQATCRSSKQKLVLPTDADIFPTRPYSNQADPLPVHMNTPDVKTSPTPSSSISSINAADADSLHGAVGGTNTEGSTPTYETKTDLTKQPYTRKKKNKKSRRKSRSEISSGSSGDQSTAFATSEEMRELAREQYFESKPKTSSDQESNLSARKDIPSLFDNVQTNVDSISTTVGHRAVSSSCGPVTEHGTSAGYQQGTDCGLDAHAPSADGQESRARPVNRGLDISDLSATSVPTVDGSSLEAAGARPKTVSLSVNDSTNANSYRRHSLRRDINNGAFRHKSGHGTVPVPVEKLAKLLLNVAELKNDFSKLNKAIKEAPTNGSSKQKPVLPTDAEYSNQADPLPVHMSSPDVKTSPTPSSSISRINAVDADSLHGAVGGTNTEGSTPTYETKTDTFSEIQYLKKKNKLLQEKHTCTVCLDRPLAVTFLPCGHLICCEECAAGLKKCPFCRKLIKSNVKTYLP